MLLCGTCDLPAKAMAYNMMQYNGEYGCSHCLQKGKTFKVGERGSVHIYPYIQENPSGPKRNDDQLNSYNHRAVDSGKPEFGVKGPSWLSVIPNYSITEGNVIDYMHCVLLGVTKMLLKLWFDTEHSAEIWYCGTKIDEADSKLLQIKPPITITRTPRSIQQHRAYWKASEYRNWLLFYSLPVMLYILPQEYLAHHMLLVESIYLLLQDSITPADLSKAEKLIRHYCFKVQYYYVERFMTANVHHLLHLPEIVRKFGPLYCYSCFTYEGLNGQLLNCIKGTQHVELQIFENINVKQSLPYMAEKYLTQESNATALYYSMTSVKYKSSKETQISKNCSALGLITNVKSLSNPVHQCALLGVTKRMQLGIFNRAIKNNQTIHSIQHTQTKKRNSYTVSYSYEDERFYGEILYFVTDFSSIYAIITPFTDSKSVFPTDKITSCSVPHIHVFARRNQKVVHVVELSSVDLCFVVSFKQHSSNIFVIQQPNNIERD